MQSGDRPQLARLRRPPSRSRSTRSARWVGGQPVAFCCCRRSAAVPTAPARRPHPTDRIAPPRAAGDGGPSGNRNEDHRDKELRRNRGRQRRCVDIPGQAPHRVSVELRCDVRMVMTAVTSRRGGSAVLTAVVAGVDPSGRIPSGALPQHQAGPVRRAVSVRCRSSVIRRNSAARSTACNRAKTSTPTGSRPAHGRAHPDRQAPRERPRPPSPAWPDRPRPHLPQCAWDARPCRTVCGHDVPCNRPGGRRSYTRRAPGLS